MTWKSSVLQDTKQVRCFRTEHILTTKDMLGVDALGRFLDELSERKEQRYRDEKKKNREREKQRRLGKITYDFEEEEESTNWTPPGVEFEVLTMIHRMRAYQNFQHALEPCLCDDVVKKIWNNVEMICLNDEAEEQKELDEEFENAMFSGIGMDRAEQTEEGMQTHLDWLGMRTAYPHWKSWYMKMAYGRFCLCDSW